MVGGLSGNHADGLVPTATTEIVDPVEGTSTVGPTLPEAISSHTATQLPDGRILIAGGLSPLGAVADCALFDPATLSLAPTGSLTVPRAFHQATLLGDGSVLVTGGIASVTGGALAQAERYDPVSGVWSAVAPLHEPRVSHVAARLADGRVLVAGGADAFSPSADAVTSIEVFDPLTSSFQKLAATTGAFHYGQSVVLPDGQVLLVGVGVSVTFNSATQALFDTPSPPTLPFAITTTRLPSGKVLLGGGYAGTTPTTTRFLFDPGTLEYAPAAPLGHPHAEHTATLLSNGDVLFAGGADDAGLDITNEWEVWHDATVGSDAWRPVVASAPASVDEGTGVTLAGSGWEGISEGGGSEFAPAHGNHPIARWLPFEGGMDKNSVAPWTPDGGTWTAETRYPGPGLLFLVTNGIPSRAVQVAIRAGVAGAACLSDASCASAFCADGICCDARCDGGCEACSAAKKGSGADGACGPVAAGTDPQDFCPTEDVSQCGLSGACDGSGRCSTYPEGQPCGTAAFCRAGTCVVGACVSDDMFEDTQGKHDCTPYRCSSEVGCPKTCASNLDCLAGYACSSADACVPDPTQDASASCGLAVDRTPRAWIGLSTAGLLFFAAAARRRSRARHP